jgi:tetratricopeptide (TPR) repeat protein
VAYNSLLIKRRKQIHEKIGKAVEELYPDRLEEFCEALAHHYSTAENWEKAFQYLRLSAEKAHRSYSTHEAFHYYNEAMNALGRLPDTEQNRRTRVDTTLSMLSVMAALNYPEVSFRILEEAARAAEDLSDRSVSARLHAQIGQAYQFAGRILEGLTFTQRAFEEAVKLSDESAVAGTAVNLCNAYFQCGEAVQMSDVAMRAISLLEKRQAASRGPIPQFDHYVVLLYDLGWARAMLGDFDEGERLCQKAVSFAAQIRSQYSLAAAHVLSGAVSIYRGKPEVLLHHAREASRLSGEAQIALFTGVSWMLEGFGHYYQDDFAAARECAERSLSLLLEHRVAMALCPAHMLLGVVSQALGNRPEARSSLEQAVKVAHDSNQKHYEGHARIYLGRALADEDISQVGTAEQCILEGLRMAEDLQFRPLQAMGHLLLGETYALDGQKQKALASLEKAREMCQEMGMDYWLARTEKALEVLQGRHRRTIVRLEQAED